MRPLAPLGPDTAPTQRLKPAVDTTFRLRDAQKAHERLEKGEQFGKVVLTVD